MLSEFSFEVMFDQLDLVVCSVGILDLEHFDYEFDWLCCYY